MGNLKRLYPPFTICKIITALAGVCALPSAYTPFYVQVNTGQSTISGVISGAVGVEKIGAGSALLSAINTYSGQTVVSAGELLINGSIPGDVTVDSGSTLGGIGTIGGLVDNTAGGIVRTGDTVGSFLTAGSYIQSVLSSLLINASPSAFDYLQVIGAAQLNGVLSVNVNSGYYSYSAYPILQAGSISGTFSSIINNGTQVGLSLSSLDYSTPGQINLTIQGQQFSF
jgi:autotransporter-associated beta strand protein